MEAKIDNNLFDLKSFETLFKEHYPYLCRYCSGIVSDKEVTEDIVQNAFLYLWNKRAELQITSTTSYLYRSVRNGALNHLKKKLTEKRHSEKLGEFIQYLQESDYSEEEVEKIENARNFINQLPSQCRLVFMMNAIEERSYKEIAEELNISVNTVKSHLARANRLLRELKMKDLLKSEQFRIILYIQILSNLLM